MRLRALPLLPVLLGLAACGGGEPAAEPPPFTPAPAAERPEAPGGRYITARLLEPTALRGIPGGRALARLKTRTEFGSRRVLGVTGRRDGWLRVVAPERPNGEAGWIPERRARLGGTNWSVHVDRSARRLTLRHDGRAVRRFPVAVGRPGTETPVGRFAVTDKLHPDDPGSPYGCCAVALSGHQTKLLPGWPGGDRLAFHGTPGDEVGVATSSGCMRVREADLRRLMRDIPVGTRVDVKA